MHHSRFNACNLYGFSKGFLQKIIWSFDHALLHFYHTKQAKNFKMFEEASRLLFFWLTEELYRIPCLFSAFLRYAGIFSMARLTGFDKANCQAQPISSFSWADFALFSGSPTYGLHNIAYGLHNIVYRLHSIACGL